MKRYGLIGYPLTHSFSKKFFTAKFDKEELECEYLNFEIEHISSITDVLKTEALQGLNVTIPHKESVIQYVDRLDEDARAIGAVNTIRVDNTTGETIGYNTDVYGFSESIAPIIQPHHNKALVLGTGGASKAVVWALNRMGIDTQLVSRSRSENTITYDDLEAKLMDEYTVIVNTTPLGTYPREDTYPDLPYHLLSERHLLYDLVYNPPKTIFLQRGEQAGAIVKNGSDMLELQALKAWEIWNRDKKEL